MAIPPRSDASAALLEDRRQDDLGGNNGDIHLETLHFSKQSFREDPKGYQMIDEISIPDDETLPDDPSNRPPEKRKTWITGMLLCSGGAALALIAHIILTVKVAANAISRGYGWGSSWSVFYEGSCQHANQTATGLHVLINIVSLVLVASSSYCCQVLTAPSRASIDRAHARRVWVSIGASSFTNVCYNSFIYVSMKSNDYGLVVAPLDFVHNATDVSTFAAPSNFEKEIGRSVDGLHADIVSGEYTRLEPSACIGAYNRAYQTSRKTLVALSPIFSGNVSAWTCRSGESSDGITTGASSEYVGCGVQVIDGEYSIFHAIVYPDGSYTNAGWPINYCLSKEVSPVCQLGCSLPIGLVVLGCIAVKLTCMMIAAFERRAEVLLTVGDALASFLRRKDPYTANNCLLARSNKGRSDALYGSSNGYPWVSVFSRASPFRLHETPPIQPKKLCTVRRLWSAALPIPLLSLLLIIKIVILVASVIAFAYADKLFHTWITSLSEPTMSSWEKKVNAFFQTKFKSFHDPGFLGLVLIVNIPQAILSLIYSVYNNVLTRLLLAAEYNDYAKERKPLRVSFPSGEQRSTYYLSVPYRYSIPFMLVFTLAHWLASQAVSIVQIMPQDVQGNAIPNRVIRGIGISSLGLKLTVALGLLTIVVVGAMMLRRFKSAAMPLALNCSAAISVACHPPRDDIDAAEKPVMWGQVDAKVKSPATYIGPGRSQLETQCRHCSFTSKEVVDPSPSFLYY